MKKKLVVGIAVYLILLIGISVFFLIRGSPNYFSYKSNLKPIQEKIDNNPSTNAGTDNTSSPGTSSNGLENSDPTKPGNSGNNGSSGNGTAPGNGTTTDNQNTTPNNPDSNNGSTPGKTTDPNQNTPQVNNGSHEETYDNIIFTRNLRIGSRGDDVKKLQYLLRKENLYTDDIDGIFGKNTYKAVLDYQMKNKIAVDGIAGRITCSKLVK